MKIEANNPDEYISKLPEERQVAVSKLRKLINKSLPEGYEETMSYGMLGWVVPHSKYPEGYHCDPQLPLPFLSMASQKNFIALYHMGIYAEPKLLEWFVEQYPNHCKRKLDMGKSCIRFKKMDDIPFKLLGELFTKLSPDQWISIYEDRVKS